jgi:hypothetical protein
MVGMLPHCISPLWVRRLAVHRSERLARFTIGAASVSGTVALRDLADHKETRVTGYRVHVPERQRPALSAFRAYLPAGHLVAFYCRPHRHGTLKIPLGIVLIAAFPLLVGFVEEVYFRGLIFQPLGAQGDLAGGVHHVRPVRSRARYERHPRRLHRLPSAAGRLSHRPGLYVRRACPRHPAHLARDPRTRADQLLSSP